MIGKDYTQGNIWRNITDFALPYMLAYFLQMLYGLADLFVIGRYCDVSSITAVSIGAQVMHMLTVVIIGLAMGTTVLTARAVGSHDTGRAASVIGNTVTLFALLAMLTTGAMLWGRDAIVSMMDTPPEAVAGTAHYLTVCFAGIPFIVAYNVIASIFRGLGDSTRPMYFVAVACAVNIALDFLFIGYMGLGPIGAALGTTLSQMASVLVALVVIRRQRAMLHITGRDLRLQQRVIGHIFNIGVPVALQDGFIQVAFIAITVIANGRGLIDAAAVGIVEKFIGLVFIVPSAMLATVSALAAQSIGAGDSLRARQVMWRAMAISVGYGVVMALVLQVTPRWAVGLFTTDPAVLAQGADYLRGYAWDCIFAGAQFCFSGFFTACGYSLISFGHNMLSISLARIPLAYLSSVYYPTTLFPMGISTCIGSILSCLICIVAYRWMVRHQRFGLAA